MPHAATQAEDHQKRWQEIAGDPLLGRLPYKVETNHRGQVALSLRKNRHTFQQKAVQKKLDRLLAGGEAFQELAIATSGGTKQADVVWASDGRLTDMKETGDPTTLAREVCVEVMSGSNDWDEMRSKRELYLEAEAEEVWVVDENDRVQFFGPEELGRSEFAPDFPDEI
ncbi:Uma2 family endonuclease [Salinibacter grassmerensis]|uniref:Uma2 family endonuclease n=1 Tax=Salinibacter grassmerensis TaxID=3040353 RepID=UPI0021E70583|nr:Uma2 family endonuclease [Salinibacter grassmerensis]